MGNARHVCVNLQSARNYFEQALENGTAADDARLGLANVYFEECRLDEASEIYNDLAESSSTEAGAEAQFKLGLTLQREQQFNDALSAYSRVSVVFGGYSNRSEERRVGKERRFVESVLWLVRHK